MRLWDAATAKELFTLKGHTRPITPLAFTPDGKLLVTTAGEDKTLKVWDCATGKEKLTIKTRGRRRPCRCWRPPDGKQAVAWVGAGLAGVLRPEYGQTGRLVERGRRPEAGERA